MRVERKDWCNYIPRDNFIYQVWYEVCCTMGILVIPVHCSQGYFCLWNKRREMPFPKISQETVLRAGPPQSGRRLLVSKNDISLKLNRIRENARLYISIEAGHVKMLETPPCWFLRCIFANAITMNHVCLWSIQSRGGGGSVMKLSLWLYRAMRYYYYCTVYLSPRGKKGGHVVCFRLLVPQ